MFNHLILIVLANPTTKQELLASINDGYAKLCEQIAKVSGEEKAKAVHTARFPYNGLTDDE